MCKPLFLILLGGRADPDDQPNFGALCRQLVCPNKVLQAVVERPSYDTRVILELVHAAVSWYSCGYSGCVLWSVISLGHWVRTFGSPEGRLLKRRVAPLGEPSIVRAASTAPHLELLFHRRNPSWGGYWAKRASGAGGSAARLGSGRLPVLGPAYSDGIDLACS